jgi:hypothetical protein
MGHHAEQAVQIAQRCEAAAFGVDKRITNSEGASVYVQQSHFVAANSLGFCAGYPFSRHTLSVAPIAGKGNKMQRDDWYTSARDPKKLADAEKVGRYAAERALARLNARKLDTRTCPVLFEAPLAAGLLGAFVQATSGGACTASRLSCWIRWASRSSRRTSRSSKTRTSPARSAPRPSTKKACAPRPARSSAMACCRATSCPRIRHASWACRPPATPAARTTST